jgi:hypothetical protein
MAEDEENYLAYESQVIRFARDDPRTLLCVEVGFTDEHFRDPRLADTYRELCARFSRRELVEPSGHVYCGPMRRTTRILREARNRPPFATPLEPVQRPQITQDLKPRLVSKSEVFVGAPATIVYAARRSGRREGNCGDREFRLRYRRNGHQLTKVNDPTPAIKAFDILNLSVKRPQRLVNEGFCDTGRPSAAAAAGNHRSPIRPRLKPLVWP